MTLYDVVTKYADDMNVNISTLEREAGLGNGSINRWKDNKSSPSIKTLDKLSDYIGIETWRLLREARSDK